MSVTSLNLYSSAQQDAQSYILNFMWNITAAGIVRTQYPLNSDIQAYSAGVVGPPAVASTLPAQSQIDAFLGSSREFLAAQFDATAIPHVAGAAAGIGFLINMNGQAGAVYMAKCLVSAPVTLAAGVAAGITFKTSPSVATISTMLNSTADTSFQVSAQGNVGCRFQFTGELWAAAAGLYELAGGNIELQLYMQPK